MHARRGSHSEQLRTWLKGESSHAGADRWRSFQSSLIDEAQHTVAFTDQYGSSIVSGEPDLGNQQDEQHHPQHADNQQPDHHHHHQLLHQPVQPEQQQQQQDHYDALLLQQQLQQLQQQQQQPPPHTAPAGGRSKAFFSASASAGLPTILNQAQAKKGGGRGSHSSQAQPLTTAQQVTFRASDAAGGVAWKSWFAKQRNAFRSFAIKLQVATEEARCEQLRLSGGRSGGGGGRSSGSDGAAAAAAAGSAAGGDGALAADATAAASWAVKPTWGTTKLLVEHLHALAQAPGDVGQMQRFLNQEIFRCIFFDFAEAEVKQRVQLLQLQQQQEISSDNLGDEEVARIGTQRHVRKSVSGGDHSSSSVTVQVVPSACRRGYFEMVFELQSRLKRLQSRVRFFLIASNETQASTKQTVLRLVFTAWAAHVRACRWRVAM
jgi:hypothetical protein